MSQQQSNSRVKPEIRLTFGKYKGISIRDVELGYLKWMAEKPDLNHGGKSWAQIAKVEIMRRQGNYESPDIQVTDGDRLDTLQSIVANQPRLGMEAIDDAVDLLLKDFMLRPNRNIRFTDWLKLVAHEVLQSVQVSDIRAMDHISMIKDGKSFTFNKVGDQAIWLLERIKAT